MSRLVRRGRVESGEVNAFCGWKHCKVPIAIGAPDIQTASAKVKAHYREKHGGEEPPD